MLDIILAKQSTFQYFEETKKKSQGLNVKRTAETKNTGMKVPSTENDKQKSMRVMK